MEAKFYKEIEKSMRIKTVKDFELVLRTKINDELELERKKNQYFLEYYYRMSVTYGKKYEMMVLTG